MIVTTEKIFPRHDDDDGVHVVEIGRVSTMGQNAENIDASYKDAEKVLKDVIDGPYQTRRFGDQESGMVVDRPAMLQAVELIESGWADVVLMEDLSRYRNPRWMMAFVQDCQDRGVRVIAPGDGFDTADPNWEMSLQLAAIKHGLYIPDTRRRVRRTADHSFEKGGMVLRTKFGYRKLTEKEAKELPDHPDDLLIAKVDEHTYWIKEMKRLIVEQGLYGEPVAAWLNGHEAPLPPYNKVGRWTWSHVHDLLRDEILIGNRTFRKTIYKPIMKTGKHRREKNKAPEEKLWPQLADLTQEEFDELQQAIDELAPKKKSKSGVDHPRHRVRRCDSITPLQHATCSICGSFLAPCGTGVVKCKRSWKGVDDRCWNHVQINSERARRVVIETVLSHIKRLPEARQVMLDAAWAEISQRRRGQDDQIKQIDDDIAKLKAEAARIADAIAEGFDLAAIKDKAASLDKQLVELEQVKAQLVDANDAGDT